MVGLRPQQGPALLRWFIPGCGCVCARQVHRRSERHGLFLLQGHTQPAPVRRLAQACGMRHCVQHGARLGGCGPADALDTDLGAVMQAARLLASVGGLALAPARRVRKVAANCKTRFHSRIHDVPVP